MSRILFTIVLATIGASQLDAQKRVRFFRNQVDANRNKTYSLTQNQGPWLIMCASFNGENAQRQANDLVYELRSQHRLEAFVYSKQFDYSNKLNGLGFSEVDTVKDRVGQTRPKPVKMKAANDVRFEEVAVVVGNFPSLGDTLTQKALEKIKFLRPRSMEVSETIDTDQSLGYLREEYRQKSNIEKLKTMGPMRQAMAIANPLLPEEYFARQTLDTTILKLNKGLTYSLLKNKKPYSVRVASFRGDSSFSKGSVPDIAKKRSFAFGGGKNKKLSKLAVAAAKAHRLTKELRKAGVEAYEFHDRHESYVCVGGFDWVKKKRRDGKDELNREVAMIVESYKATVVNFGGHEGLIQPRSLPKLRHLGIVFDVQPTPVTVPKVR